MKKDKNTGLSNPSAFPFTKTTYKGIGSPEEETFTGMSLRDYFAAKALAVLIKETSLSNPTLDFETISNQVAKLSYIQADAMLRERE